MHPRVEEGAGGVPLVRHVQHAHAGAASDQTKEVLGKLRWSLPSFITSFDD